MDMSILKTASTTQLKDMLSQDIGGNIQPALTPEDILAILNEIASREGSMSKAQVEQAWHNFVEFYMPYNQEKSKDDN